METLKASDRGRFGPLADSTLGAPREDWGGGVDSEKAPPLQCPELGTAAIA